MAVRTRTISRKYRERGSWRRLTIESLEMRTMLSASAGSAAVLEATSDDVASSITPAVNLRLLPVATVSPADTAASLPTAITTVTGAGQTFYVEIWAHNADSSPHGIVGGYVDVGFAAQLIDATAVSAGGVYNICTQAVIDNASGQVAGAGGIASPGIVDLGDNEWVRLATITFRTTSTGTVSFTASPGTDQLARANEGALAWSSVDLASAGAQLTVLPGDPTTIGLFDPHTCTFYLRDSNTTGAADWTFGYGAPELQWTALVGDWNGDQGDTVGFLDPASCMWYLRDSLSSGYATYTFPYGNPELDWTPLVGDWDGDGSDSIGFFDSHTCTWYLTDVLTGGYADYTFLYGAVSSGWTPLVGDWDGNGTDTIGFYDPQTATWYLRNSLSTGVADWTFAYGAPGQGWQPLVGDWNGDGRDTIGFFDATSSLFYLRNSLSTGNADATFGYGAPHLGWEPLIGKWQAPVTVSFPTAVAEELAASTWVDFDTTDASGADTAPKITIDCVDGTAVGHVSVAGVGLTPTLIGDQAVLSLSIPDCGTTDAVGSPELPVLRTLLSIPEGASLSPTVSAESQIVALDDLGIDLAVAPHQASVEKTDDAMADVTMTVDEWAYAVNQYTTTEPVEVVSLGTQDGTQLVLVEVRPVAYNPVTHTLQVWSDIRFSLDLGVGSSASASEAQLVGAAAATTDSKATGRLLIITSSDFTDTLASFVTFKTNQGWTVDLVDTGATGTTTTAIRNYIIGRYSSVSTQPDAVLLVGDTDRIPCFTGVGDDNPSTDLYYACMDSGDDWYPELAIGRFSVSSAAELEGVIAKTIYYQESSAGTWTKQAVFMAGNDNYSITEGTHNYVISNYLDAQGYTSTKLYEQTYGATTSDVTNAFNSGVALGIYSGHGSQTSWADGPAFSQSNVRALTNEGMYPFVASFACLTGSYETSECFAETWLRAADYGAVDIWASSVTSYWTEDDILEKTLFAAIYSDGQSSFGNATLRAKQRYLEYFGVSSTTRRYFEMYNLLGDPTSSLVNPELCITTPSETATAYLNEGYSLTLQAANGTSPYTWSIVAGTLPAGLNLNTSTGVISGAPLVVADTYVTVHVVDAAGDSDTRQLHLVAVERLVIASESPLPTASLGVAYSTALTATGGSTPYSWTVATIGSYAEHAATSPYLSSGTAQGWRDDEASWTLDLPFPFPFYAESYTSVHVCSNGYLDFASASAEYSNSNSGLVSNVRIAPLWDDLCTDGDAAQDIYVTETSDYVAIRWQGETYSTGAAVEFEAVLYADGTIEFNYGATMSGISPTIGISNGDGTNYLLSQYNGQTSISIGTAAHLVYAAPLPPGLSLASNGVLSGMPTEIGSYAFDIRVRDSGTRIQTALLAYQIAVIEEKQLSVTLPEFTSEGSGTLVNAGIVSLNGAIATALTVNLTWAGSSEVTSVSTVTIPAGQSSASFNLVVGNDTLLDGTQTAELTASATNCTSSSAAIDIYDNETTTLGLDLPSTIGENAGTVSGTLTLAQAPGRDVNVLLRSSDTTEIATGIVTVPTGATSVPFTLAVLDDALFDGAQTVTVVALVENWTSGSDTISVTDNDATLTVSLPTQAWEGQGVLAGAGVVRLGGTATTDLVIALSSSDTTELTTLATVTIPAGQSSGTFNLTVQDDAFQDGAQNVTVTATASGLPKATATTVIRDNDPYRYQFAVVGVTQLGSEPFAVGISALDIDGEAISVFAGTVTLTATGSHGVLPCHIASASNVTFTNGQWTGTVAVDALDTNVYLWASGNSATGQSNTFNVVHGTLNHFSFSEISSPQWVDNAFTVTISACDSHGFVVSDFTGTASLSCGGADSVVTVGTGVQSASFPLDATAGQCRTQSIYYAEELGAARTIEGLAINVNSLPGGTLGNFTLRLKQTSADSFSTPTWESTGWTTVYQNATTIGSTGWVYVEFVTPFEYNGTDNLLVDLSFSNSIGYTAGTAQVTDTGLARTVYCAAGSQYASPLTWSSIGGPAGNLSTQVPNLRFSMVGCQIDVTPATTGVFVAGRWSGAVSLAGYAAGLTLSADDGAGHCGTSNTFNVSGSVYDLDGSGRVGTGDFALFSPAWHSRPGDANWNAAADFTSDQYVDQTDFVLLQQHWHTTVGVSSTSGTADVLSKLLDELSQTTVDEDDLDLLTQAALGGLG